MEKISNDRLLVEEFKRDFIIIIIIITIIMKNYTNINTQKFSKKKEMLGIKENELSHLGRCDEASFRNVSLKRL